MAHRNQAQIADYPSLAAPGSTFSMYAYHTLHAHYVQQWEAQLELGEGEGWTRAGSWATALGAWLGVSE